MANNRIKKIENLDACVNIKEQILLQNAITVIEGLSTITQVDEVDSDMNQITSIPY